MNPFTNAVATEFKEIPIDQILIENRQREDLGDLETLKTTIQQYGLIEPILVQRVDSSYRLIAGERRLTAFKELGHTTIPAGIVDKPISADILDALELYENIARKSLSFDEEAKAYARMAKVVNTGVSVDKSKLSSNLGIVETAKILGVSPGHLSESQKLAAALEAAPELAQLARNRTDALNLLSKMSQQADLKEAAQRVQHARKASTEPDEKTKLIDAYVIADAFKFIEDLAGYQFQFIEFDPPYSIGHGDRNKNRTASSMFGHYEDMSSQDYIHLMSFFASHLYRVAMSDAWLICWTGVYGKPADKALPPWFWFETCYTTLSSAGWQVDPVPAVWYKEGRASIRQDAQTQLSMQTEMFLVCRKGNARLTTPARGNVFEYRPLHHTHTSHKAEKPIRLYESILRTFASPGDKLLSPFCGSGNVLLAGANYGCDVVGCDKSDEYKPSYIMRVANEPFARYKDKDDDNDNE